MVRTKLLAAFAACALAGASVSCDNDGLLDVDNDEDFDANLTAAAEIPAPGGSPTATGDADISWDDDDNVLTVRVVVNGQLTSDVTMAHIHGPASTSGTAAIALDFVPSMTAVINAGTRTGTIVSASYDFDTLEPSANGVLRVEASTLLNWMRTGQAYVNVHTETNPAGEIRGQITDD